MEKMEKKEYEYGADEAHQSIRLVLESPNL
jgi:hypothetical protein